jgi:chromosome segregation ATPase
MNYSEILNKIQKQQKENEDFWNSIFPKISYSEEEYDELDSKNIGLTNDILELNSEINTLESKISTSLKENNNLTDKVYYYKSRYDNSKTILLLLRKKMKDKIDLSKEEINLIKNFVCDNDFMETYKL